MANLVKSADDKTKIYTLDSRTIGEVKIADDVVASIAVLAAREVEGFDDMEGNTTRLMNSVKARQPKGVRVDVVNNMVRVDLTARLKYGYGIRETCSKIQEKIKTAIENMTGLKVTDVNIRVAGVNTEARA
ncbi:MAG: Asp23/Gls24 family envelope stress response protein [Lachnospiraceae bacterium]|nr:Asp23/Gls24 family envelope stress response protein [Lachnospiraceae bacterium]MBR1875831.1 Asp23/Gls24 family envelope stress response protein [Lachnospiraceae bacterium]